MFDGTGRCQIEAQSQFNHSTNDKRSLDTRRSPLRCFLGKLEPAQRIRFPEVDARSEPIVIVVAGREGRARQQSLADALVAAVIAEDESRGEAMQGD